MKTLAALLLALSQTVAMAQSCGFPPFPPFGTTPVCICDARGNCHWVFVAKR